MTTEATVLFLVVGFVVGLVVGSFANVVVSRVPKGESIVRPGSRCPSCGTPVRTRDNIPVVSWLVLHGRCRTCGWQIPVRYPMVEAAGGAIGLLVAVVVVVVGGLS